jgi:hypothetical protein
MERLKKYFEIVIEAIILLAIYIITLPVRILDRFVYRIPSK